MKRLVILSLLGLAACGPMGLYYKPGESLARTERDEVACKVRAEREVPVRQVTRVIPGRWIPGRRICPKPDKCHVTPGHMSPPTVITEDANLALRNKVAALCMADRGYARISLPPCPPEIADATPPAITTTMPKCLSANACVIRRKGGTFQVVDPG